MSGLRKILLMALLLAAAAARAEVADRSWIFSPVMGVSQPALHTLYDGVFRAPFKGQAQITTSLPEDVEGEVTYPVQDFLFYNPLPDVGVGPEAGLEFRRIFGPRNDFMIGVSSWEISSKARIDVVFPLQGAPDNQAEYERRANFSFTQYYVGWRRYLFDRSRSRNMYFNLSLHEIFDVDYEEDNVFTFTSGPPTGFKRIVVLQSQATGILIVQGGIGADFRVADRFSISLEGNYALGLREAPLKGLRGRADFNQGDRLMRYPDPVAEDAATGVLIYLNEDGLEHRDVRLNFSGWKALVKFNINF